MRAIKNSLIAATLLPLSAFASYVYPGSLRPLDSATWVEDHATDFLSLCAAMNGNITLGYQRIEVPESFKVTIKALLNEAVTFDCLEAVEKIERRGLVNLRGYTLTELRPLYYFYDVYFYLPQN